MILTVPDNITVESPSPIAVFYPPAKVKGGKKPITINYSKASGSIFPFGETQVKVTAFDAKGNTVSGGFIIRVDPSQVVPNPLQITTPSLPSGEVGVFYSQQLQGTGGTPPYTWSIFSGSLPAGLSLVNDTVQGTPTTAGTSNFQIKLQDNVGAQVFRDFSIVVTALPLVITTSSPLPNAAQGEFYSTAINATGGATPYTLSKISGTFPTGISISGMSLTGTPTTLQTQNFTLRVTDSLGATADKAFSLTVADEAPNDYYEELIARPDAHLWLSLRSQSELDANMDSTSSSIIRSSAGSPTVIDCGSGAVTVVSSVNGLLTFSGGNPVPSDGMSIEVTGHSLTALNGVFQATRVSATQAQVAGISGSGTGGSAYRAHSRCHNDALITIQNHVAIPDGTYIAQRINIRQLELYNTNGTPVSSTGGSNVGTYRVKCWEYFPDTGRTDPDSPAQDAAKGVIPEFYGADLTRQIRITYNISNQSFLTTWDTWLSSALRQRPFDPKVASKIYRHDGNTFVSTNGLSQDWLLYPGRSLDITGTTPGNPTTVTVAVEHYFTTGDIVTFFNSTVIPDGNYVATVTGSKTFTIPLSTASGSSTGTCEHSLEVGRCNSTFPASGAFIWLAGYTDVSDNRSYPTGLNGPPSGGQYTGTLPLYANIWNRKWYYFQMGKTGFDSQLNDWNNSNVVPHFGAGKKVGVWNVSASVDGSGVATITCTDGPHGYRLNDKVDIIGISGVSGTYTIASVPASPSATSSAHGGFTGPTTFTVNGATPGASGSGQSAIYITILSAWIADELRNPIVLFDRVPMHDYDVMSLFRLEWDSSNDSQPMPDGQVYFYNRNVVCLLNPTNVSSILRKPVG